VFVAAGIVSNIPTPAAIAVGIVVQVIADTTRELQMRLRENKDTFLDQVNQQLLIPRRIYAMIVVFKHKLPGQQQGLLGKLSSSIGQAFFSKEKLTSIRQLKSTAIPLQPSQSLNKVLILSDWSVARRTKSRSRLMRRRWCIQI
jgi:hypothetical protein